MADTLQFVDAISTSPTVRLDLNDDTTWGLDYEGTSFDPPRLKTAWSGTLLHHGERQAASVYTNRLVRLRLDLMTSTVDGQGEQLQALWRELDRPENILKWQPEGATSPVFFRTIRSANNRVRDYPGSGKFRTVEVEIDAKPHAEGLRVQVNAALNENSTFESGTTGWSPTSAALAQSSAFARSGTYSLRITPAGGVTPVDAQTGFLPVTAGRAYTARLYAYSVAGYPAAFRSVIGWYDGSGTFISSDLGTSVVLPAGAWTEVKTTAVAPTGATQAKMLARYAGTPAASDVVYVDDVTFAPSTTVYNNPAATANGMFFDVDDPAGDVETPLILQVVNGSLAGLETGSIMSTIAVRRGGTPSSAPRLLQAEAMVLGTDTTLPGADSAMSGSGSNYARCSFSTATAMTKRLGLNYPTAAGDDVRGVYRAYLRYRKSVAGDAISVRLRKGDLESSNGVIYNDTVSLPTTHTGPALADLGEVAYPASPDPVYDATGALVPVGGYGLAIEAQRVSGSGNIDFDYLLLVPADDATGYARWSDDTGHGWQVIDGVARSAYVLGSGGEVDRPINQRYVGGGWPHINPGQSNRVYSLLNGQNNQITGGGAVDSITSTTDIDVYYMPRYLYVRPATT